MYEVVVIEEEVDVPSDGADDNTGSVQAVTFYLNKYTYSLGESIDGYVHGKRLGADGNLVEFTSTDFAVSGYNPYLVSEQRIILSYADYECSFVVTVEATAEDIIGIEVQMISEGYYIGQELEMAVYAITAAGNMIEVMPATEESDGYIVTGYDPYVEGDQEIVVSYMGYSCYKTVYVKNSDTVVTYSIEAYSNKNVYYLGEALDITVMLVENGVAIRQLSADEYTIEGYDAYVPGEQEVIITYGNSGTSLFVWVEEVDDTAAVPISIAVNMNKEVYDIGEELDMRVIVYYSDGTVREVWDFAYEGFDSQYEGEYTVMVFWGDFVCETMAWVKTGGDQTGEMELRVWSNRESYMLGEELDLTAELLTADGNVMYLSPSEYFVLDYDMYMTGWQSVCVVYGSLSVWLDVYVEASETTDPVEPPVTENGAVIYASTATTFTGSQETIAVSIRNNPGVAGYKVRVRYDNTVLTPVMVEKGDVALSGITTNIQDDSADLANLEYVSVVGYGSDNAEGDGVLFYITFDVSEDAPVGVVVDIVLEEGQLTDALGDDVAYCFENGYVEILQALYGDANGDGEITVKDLVIMSQYVSGYEGNVYDSVFMKLGDVYRDGRINTKDMVLLSRYLADWQNVELGKAVE